MFIIMADIHIIKGLKAFILGLPLPPTYPQQWPIYPLFVGFRACIMGMLEVEVAFIPYILELKALINGYREALGKHSGIRV